MCPTEGNKSATKQMVLSLYLIFGTIILSVCPEAMNKSNCVNGEGPFSSTKFKCPLSCMGKIFSLRKLAFSRALGCVAHFQCSALLQYLAFLKTNSSPPPVYFTPPPQ